MTTIARERPVKFNLPRRLMRLEDVAYNLWWVWHPEVQRLFRSDEELLREHARHKRDVYLPEVDTAR